MHTHPSVTQRLIDALTEADPCYRVVTVSDSVLAAIALETGMHLPSTPRPYPLDQLPALPLIDFGFLVGVGPSSPDEPAPIQHDQVTWDCYAPDMCGSKAPLRSMKHTLVIPPHTLTPVQAEIYKCLREDGMPLQTAEKVAIRLAPATVTQGGDHEDLQTD